MTRSPSPPTLSSTEVAAYRAELARLKRLRELEAQRIERAWAGAPPFYCDRPACDGHEHPGFPYRHARAVQRPPPGDWSTWWLRGGRGGGKTRAGAEWFKQQGRRLVGSRGALVGSTLEDVRLTMVEGEALALGTPVATPDGFKPIGDIQPGDLVVGADGTPTKVTWVSDVAYGRPCYRITFDDGTSVVADAAHKWLTEDRPYRAAKVRNPRSKLTPRVRTTEEIAATVVLHGWTNHAIPVAAPLELPTADLPIPPYTLGAWLGDGTAKNASITTADPEVLQHIADDGFALTELADNGTHGLARSYGILGLQKWLRLEGFRRNKHVPAIYLRGSYHQRLAILQGLLDTDGYVSERGQVAFDNTNHRLAEAVWELACSLGIKAAAPRLHRPAGPGHPRDHYRVTFTTGLPVFHLRRKLDRLRGPRDTRSRYRFIKTVEQVPSVPVKCIAVDADDQLFLITRSLVATHNSGLLSVLPPSVLRGGSVDDSWNRGPCELYLANGTRWKGFSSEKPGRLRGPQHHYAWGDEPAEWDDASVDPTATTKGTTMSNLEFGLRLGTDPRLLLTGTPKTVLLIRRLLWRDGDREKGPAPNVAIVRTSTYDNLDNLAPTFKAKILDSYEGTTLGLQELHAEYLDETPGALWKRELLQRDRVRDHPDLTRIAVGVDPSGGAGEIGIVVVGKQPPRDGYVLDDRSGRYTPEGWGRAAVLAWHDWKADMIVVETNFGGDMAVSTIKVAAAALIEEHRQLLKDEAVAPADAITTVPYVKVTHSSRGKKVRAEPISAASEQGRIHMVGLHARLEDQLTDWVVGESDYSPDRLDAMVFACVELGLGAFAGRARFGGMQAAQTQLG
jgi:phage terminase large subunit-like protein